MRSIIIRPIISEQSMKDATVGKFTFQVGRFDHKSAIRDAIEQAFGVNVEAIATAVVKGKRMRIGKRREEVRKTPWKKAIVRLAKGEKIAAFDIGATEG
jgi:large subunit ribosomal protein L23